MVDFLLHKETQASAKEKLQAGTGDMLSLSESIRQFQENGYVENLVPCFDHWTCQEGSIKLHPDEIYIDEVVRFENSSDPDDQAILYAISSLLDPTIKGLYVDSYGLYHDELSQKMIERIRASITNQGMNGNA